MPGHHGNPVAGLSVGINEETLKYDLTELDGLDVLSEPEECIQEAQEKTAKTFGVAHSYFLINGSSAGLIAAMMSLVKEGDKVLLPRNVHRSILSGLILTGAQPVWHLTEYLNNWGVWDAVTPEQLSQQLESDPDIKLCVVTSPTYDGIASDLNGIASVCKKHNVFLIVDEAHGSLFSFSDELPVSACQLDKDSPCDAVVHSLHKSAGSLTQTALAHLPKGSRINPALFQQSLNIIQSTSPSYILMASLDQTCGFLASDEFHHVLSQYRHLIKTLRGEFNTHIKNFELFETGSPFWDDGRFLIRHKYHSTSDWAETMEADQRLAYESVNGISALYLTGLGLDEAMCEHFINAFKKADTIKYNNSEESVRAIIPHLPQMALTPRDAFFAASETISKENAVGRIARETIVHCPPGIPVLISGEIIQNEHLPYLNQSVLVIQ